MEIAKEDVEHHDQGETLQQQKKTVTLHVK